MSIQTSRLKVHSITPFNFSLRFSASRGALGDGREGRGSGVAAAGSDAPKSSQQPAGIRGERYTAPLTPLQEGQRTPAQVYRRQHQPHPRSLQDRHPRHVL